MKRLNELFDLHYGVNLELINLTVCDTNNKNHINFVSRISKNNGVVALVEKLAGVQANPAGSISVSAGGSVAEAFLQKEEYYSGRDVYK